MMPKYGNEMTYIKRSNMTFSIGQDNSKCYVHYSETKIFLHVK
jgi:hypothetical protein